MELQQVKAAESIVGILNEIPDVCRNLEKRTGLWEYCDKIGRYADCFAYYQNGTLFGFSATYANDKDTKTAFITLIACLPGERGKGYGSNIFEHLTAHVKTKGMEILRLEVAESNPDAFKFYIKHGMRVVSATKHGYIMQKVL